MNGRRDPRRVRTDPSPYPPRYRYHDRNLDAGDAPHRRADRNLAERTVQAIYTEGN
ncbi:hypothetical protein ACTXJ8_07065 [Corynebacterium variabile]|uniref:hypothetical protein n=1 Tax=Corynebacterium variabile TaxID=1727 RepID=UPI003FD69D0B